MAKKTTQSSELSSAVAGGQSQPQDIQSTAVGVLKPLRDALAMLINSLPVQIAKPTDLQKLLSLDAKLAWQVYKFAFTDEMLSASLLLPGSGPMRRFLDCAAQSGVSQERIESVRQAFTAFEGFVATAFGDRASYNAMVESDDADGSATLAHKRAIFRAAAHFTGQQQDTQTITFIVRPTGQGQPARWDVAIVVYKHQLRRLRPDSRVVLAHVSVNYKPGSSRESWYEPLEKDVPAGLVASTIPAFCTSPYAETVQTHMKGELLEMELATGGLGLASATDWAFGLVQRNSVQSFSDPTPFNVEVACAVKNLVFDVMLDESIHATSPSRLQTFLGFLDTDTRMHGFSPKLSVYEDVVSLGGSVSAMDVPSAPRYTDLIRHSLGRLHWENARFRIYRCAMQYPILGTSLRWNFLP